MIRVLFVALLCIVATPAQAHEIDCDLIRRQIAEHGRAKALAWALKQGYSLPDIWKIRRQCRV